MSNHHRTADRLTILFSGILCAFCLMVVLFLITSIEAVTYWTPGYYEKEYTRYQVLEDLPDMTMDDLLFVTDEMMAYLRGKRDDLQVIITTIDGEKREFFSDREIAHMADVKKLFSGGLWLRRIGVLLLLLTAVCLFFWQKRHTDRRHLLARFMPYSLCMGTGIFFTAALILTAIISTDFTKYFLVFHHILFDNTLWILYPDEDLMINMVPEPFFIDTALRIAAIFGGLVLIFFFICFLLWRRNIKKA